MEKKKPTKEDQDKPGETKRATRKRRPVLKEQNFPSDDSDFEEDKTSYRKAPSPAKNPKTKAKAKTSKLSGKKGKEKESQEKEKEREEVPELQQDRLKMRRRNVNNNLVSLLGGFSSGLVSRNLVTAAAVRSEWGLRGQNSL